MYKAIIKEKLALILMLGILPTFAVTRSSLSGIGMGLSTCFVLMMSNLIVSPLRKKLSERIRISVFIIVVVSLTTISDLLIQNYAHSLYVPLGVYIPLIVINCLILGKAENYASNNGPIASFCNGFGMGLSFAGSLTLIATIRELINSNSILGFAMNPQIYLISVIITLFIGVFLTLMFFETLYKKLKASNKMSKMQSLTCCGDCANCFDARCTIDKRVPKISISIPDTPKNIANNKNDKI